MRKLVYSIIAISFFIIILVLPDMNNSVHTDNFDLKFDKRHYSISELNQVHFDKKIERKSELRSKGDHFKFDNPDKYQDYNWAIRKRDSEISPSYLTGYTVRAYREALDDPRYQLKKSLRTQTVSWKERGPFNVPGRTRALVVLPQDVQANTWLAGAVGGGIWKTSDGGLTWENKTPDLPTLAISWLDVCKADPDIIYAATGESNGAGRGLTGNGVFKSEDGGETWKQLPSTADNISFTFINRIIVNQNDPDVVLLCTSQGEWEREFRSEIYKSTDGGTSWKRVYNSTRWISQIIANPENFNTIYASEWLKGVIKSTNAGESWFDASIGFQKVIGRIELAVAPTDSARVYASVQGILSGTGSDLYVSTDAGAKWSYVEQKYEDQYVDFLGGQGDYDNTIGVNPYNENEVYYGGVSLWKTRLKSNSTTIDVPTVSVDVANGELSQWDFMNFGGTYFNGKLEVGETLNDEDFVDIELRTGPGLSQKAHRFTVGKRGAGVPDGSYIYRDYVTVPFQVWDTDNNQQLMVSFRDQQEDGLYNLIEQNTEDGDEANHSREYLFIQKVNYTETPHEEIAQNGGENKGHTYNQLYFFWPVLQDGIKWDQENMPEDTITVDYEIVTIEKRFGEVQPVSDAYGEFLKLNPAFDSDVSKIEFHPDHHNLIMIPMDNVNKEFKILNGNDGGVYISNIADVPGINDGDWTFSGNGFNSGQFYSATKKPGADQFIGGLQDNGTWISPSGSVADATTPYSLAIGGDGFDVLWNYADPDLILGGSQGNNFFRSDDGGNTWTSSIQGLDGVMPFFSKLASSNSHPDRVFTLSSLGVYRSNDFGQSWTLAPISHNWTFTNFMEIKVSIANHDIVWAGSGMSGDRAIHVSTDGGKTFSETKQFLEAELGILSGFSTHPENDSTAFALFSFAKGPKILRTTDLGESWEDISGFGSGNSSTNGFPDVAVYSLLVRPDNSNIIWAGTEIGIFESSDDGLSWSFFEGDVGSAAIWEMKVVDDQVVLATHGRGIYTATIPLSEDVVMVPKIVGAGTSIQGDLNVLVQLRSLYDSTELFIDNQRVEKNSVNEIGERFFTVSGLAVTGDSVNVKVISYKKGRKYETDPAKALLFDVNTPTVTYEQNFDVNALGDFVGFGFTIEKPDGFDNEAIHSDHPYLEGSGFPGNIINSVFQLKTPIIVSSRNATIKYEDIAVVEPGERLTLFPSADFYDYVIVEGSKDGVVWQNFGRGYDAAKNGNWTNAFEGSQQIDNSLFISESVDIDNVFQAKDTIFVRFRLYSDAFTNGWGWAIDNLAIQSVITDLKDQDILAQSIKIYPNPTSDYFNIANIENNENYELLLFNVNGAVVKNEIISASLSQEITINVSGVRPGTYIVKLKSSKREYSSKVIIN